MKEKNYYSCEEIQGALYLAPNQIRTCCKRYFVNKTIYGDIVLLDKIVSTPSVEEILASKCALIHNINGNDNHPCRRCPWLRKADWEDMKSLKINHLSLEYHTHCNMKCIYCSDKYNGGDDCSYLIIELLKRIKNSGALDQCKSVAWGGGEPLIGGDFANLFDTITSEVITAKNRVFSNATIFSERLSSALRQKKASLVTSIDAGTSKTFSKLHGTDAHEIVLSNLSKYFNEGAYDITIKYILTTEGNTSKDEISAFIKSLSDYSLLKANVQISCNFKKPLISLEIFNAALCLREALISAGVDSIHFDDHLQPKLGIFAQNNPNIIEKCYSQVIASPQQNNRIAIWGAGQYSKRMIETSFYLKSSTINYFVDNDESKQGKLFLDKPVYSPNRLKNDNLPIVIGLSNGYNAVQKQLIDLGIDENRLVKEIIL